MNDDDEAAIDDMAAAVERLKGYENDAWKKFNVLMDENTKRWHPRADLRVEALGCDRAVRVSFGTRGTSQFAKLGEPVMHFDDKTCGPRNISTMRELAQAILDACDFVEQVNPKWASHGKPS